LINIIAKALIRIYWNSTKPENRNVCLFNPSCSMAVYNELDKGGFISGVKLFFFRKKHCKKGFNIVKNGDEIILKSVKGFSFNESEINPVILKEFKV
jgi:putative component of membrane protein insertase Oxa1/YidC/SpoIIIJ protein YidD